MITSEHQAVEEELRRCWSRGTKIGDGGIGETFCGKSEKEFTGDSTGENYAFWGGVFRVIYNIILL